MRTIKRELKVISKKNGDGLHISKISRSKRLAGILRDMRVDDQFIASISPDSPELCGFLIPEGESNTHRGADTAIVATAAPLYHFNRFEVNEILCKPYHPRMKED